jgi:hypothetical protein
MVFKFSDRKMNMKTAKNTQGVLLFSAFFYSYTITIRPHIKAKKFPNSI